MSDIYVRQRNMNIDRDINVCIVGCGGVGFNAGLQFAMAGVESFVLFDSDIIEEHNLNRLPVPFSCIGMNKAKVLKEMIRQMRPHADVVIYKSKFDDMLLNSSDMKVDWIVDCTDDFSAQKRIYQDACDRDINYCKMGYDGERISINNKVATWDIDENDNQGYNVTPSWAVPATVVAALGVAKVMKYNHKETSLEIKNMYYPEKENQHERVG